MFNSADEPLACARLRALVRCRLPSGRVVDVALVRRIDSSSWRPRTDWDGRWVFEETTSFDFLLVDHIIRGALLTPVLPKPSGRSALHFLVDVVDGDMFLR
ncbi:hypothetical protein MKEN_00306800 [Mycena kentingensis (nom. inval.)]|nr:hypothetical protein MKEN_00306800 [Mycena kentingensis (nom. inval.)]